MLSIEGELYYLSISYRSMSSGGWQLELCKTKGYLLIVIIVVFSSLFFTSCESVLKMLTERLADRPFIYKKE